MNDRLYMYACLKIRDIAFRFQFANGQAPEEDAQTCLWWCESEAGCGEGVGSASEEGKRIT